jgi:hypothetical protein
MTAPHKATYSVTVKIEPTFELNQKPTWVARDQKGNWRSYWSVDRAGEDITPEQLVSGGMFHAEEVESVSVVDGVITAIIREW